MKLYDIPFIPEGYKTIIAGYGTLLVGVGAFVTSLGSVLGGHSDISVLVESFMVMMAGLSVLGIGSKAQRILDTKDGE
jgi:hypothetical protein